MIGVGLHVISRELALTTPSIWSPDTVVVVVVALLTLNDDAEYPAELGVGATSICI